MVRIDLIIGFVALALFIFCLVDVISIYDSRIKTLNKIAWVFIIILVPLIGPILWLAVGKERGGDRPAERARNTRPVAPDDDPAFLRNVDVQESQEARIRRLEAELKRLGDDKPEQ
jgi:Phospholipase_D-nuclease N-terminal